MEIEAKKVAISQLFGKDIPDPRGEATPRLTEVHGSAPEATFLRGVSYFKKSHGPNVLKEVYRLLKFDYSHSSWAQRGFPYWNL